MDVKLVSLSFLCLHYSMFRDYLDDVGGDALARCSDCELYPAEEECSNII